MRISRHDLIFLYCFNRENKFVKKSLFAISEENKGVKNDEIVLILLITIFVLFFFATSLKVFITLLISGLVIGIFGLAKNYKERRKNEKKNL